jgi:putative membrane protein
MTGFVLAGFGFLVLFAIVQVAGVLTGRRSGRERGVIALFLLPFVAVPFFLTSSSATMASQGQLTLSPKLASARPAAGGSKSALLIPPDGTIVLDDENFYGVYNAIYDNPKKFEGRRVTLSGFAYRDAPNLGSGEFVTARNLMWCCAADTSLIGFLTRLPAGTLPSRDDWVSLSGTLGVTSYKTPSAGTASDVPLLTVDLLQHEEAPSFAYVYPTF